MPLRLALAVREIVAGRRLGALEVKRGVTVGYKAHWSWRLAPERQWLGIGWAPWRGGGIPPPPSNASLEWGLQGSIVVVVVVVVSRPEDAQRPVERRWQRPRKTGGGRKGVGKAVPSGYCRLAGAVGGRAERLGRRLGPRREGVPSPPFSDAALTFRHAIRKTTDCVPLPPGGGGRGRASEGEGKRGETRRNGGRRCRCRAPGAVHDARAPNAKMRLDVIPHLTASETGPASPRPRGGALLELSSASVHSPEAGPQDVGARLPAASREVRATKFAAKLARITPHTPMPPPVCPAPPAPPVLSCLSTH